MTDFLNRLRQFWTDDAGISSVEYALLLAFVGAGVVGGAAVLSNAVSGEMTTAKDCIESGTVAADGTVTGC